MLCVIFNTSTLLHPSTSPWENGWIPQAGITYADMPSCRQADTTTQNNDDISTWRHEVHPKLAKGEKHPTTTDSAADFLKRKSHSSLGRFLHVPLR